MRDQLAAHVAIPTGYNHIVGLEEYRGILTDRLTALGAALELIPGTPREPWLNPKGTISDEIPPMAVLRRHSGSGHFPKVMIAGHLDTVFDPAGTFLEMTISADGSTANGPGVVDMKGGILIAVTALEALAEAGVDIPRPEVFSPTPPSTRSPRSTSSASPSNPPCPVGNWQFNAAAQVSS